MAGQITIFVEKGFSLSGIFHYESAPIEWRPQLWQAPPSKSGCLIHVA